MHFIGPRALKRNKNYQRFVPTFTRDAQRVLEILLFKRRFVKRLFPPRAVFYNFVSNVIAKAETVSIAIGITSLNSGFHAFCPLRYLDRRTRLFFRRTRQCFNCDVLPIEKNFHLLFVFHHHAVQRVKGSVAVSGTYETCRHRFFKLRKALAHVVLRFFGNAWIVHELFI